MLADDVRSLPSPPNPPVASSRPGFTDTIWPTELYITPNHYYDSVQTFSVIALVGLILFMFIMGMELDQVGGGHWVTQNTDNRPRHSTDAHTGVVLTGSSCTHCL
jgi:hypothetical protein